MARHRQLAALTLLALVACKKQKAEVVVVDASVAPPPFQRCESPNRSPLFERVEQAYGDRSRELRVLTGLVSPRDDDHTLRPIGRDCTWPDDVNARVALAEKDFLARTAKLERPGPIAIRTAGCEEDGRLVVGLTRDYGVYHQYTAATYKVDTKTATHFAEGLPVAHLDLDGDGRRDFVWAMPHARIVDFVANVTFAFEAGFAKGGARVKTDITWRPSEYDRDYVLGSVGAGGVPRLANEIVLVFAGRDDEHPYDHPYVEKRLRWDGQAFTPIEAIAQKDFELRVKNGVEAKRAVDARSHDGPFARLRPALERCSKITERDPSCEAVADEARRLLVTGGLAPDEARELVRDHLGWPCPPAPGKK